MPLGRYLFSSLFDYYPATNVIIPKFTTLINGYRFEKGTQIIPTTYTGGVNLYQAVGKAFAGEWDNVNKIVTIAGVYQ
jgi:hypothetical protein